MPKLPDPAIIERNRKIIELWNSDHSLSAGAIGMKLFCSRETICGVIHRARANNLITRPKKAVGKIGRVAKRRAIAYQSIAQLSRTPLPTIVPELSLAMHKAVTGLREHQCRYPLECDDPNEFQFCGATQQDKSSFCSEHHRIVYPRGTNDTKG